MGSLLSDLLSDLGVRHTEWYSDARFSAMPFQSLFGLSNLLKEYGVGSTALRVPAAELTSALGKLPIPFLADTPDGFVIVLGTAGSQVKYRSQGKIFSIPVDEFASAWNGVALICSSDDHSCEPGYVRHNIARKGVKVKHAVLWILASALLLFLLMTNPLASGWTLWCLAAVTIAGIWFSWMLVQKSLGIKNKHAEAVCSALEDGGCDEIAQSEAASFLGLFKWSEVGLAYFSVSLLALLLLPETMPALAAINILCLPYTLWSLWYQRFKAKTWCTLCVCVQGSLWALFFIYLTGGVTSGIDLLSGSFLTYFVALGCAYVVAILAINRIDDALSKLIKK